MTKGKVTIQQDRCKSCGFCVEVCPQHVLLLSDIPNIHGYFPVAFDEQRGNCTGCAICALVCPDLVFTVWRERVPTRRIPVAADAAA